MNRRRNRLKKTWNEKMFDLINGLIMVLICLFIAYPLYFVLLASFTDPTIIGSGKLLLFPQKIYFGGYEKVFSYRAIWIGYFNTIKYTVAGTMVSICLTVPCAFALSRKYLFGRKVINFLFTFTMFFGGGIIPMFLLVNELHIYNTIWAMVLPSALSVYNMIVCRSFFSSNIPDELYDAARIDGSNDFTFFFKIAIPLSKAILAVLIMFYATANWNTYMNAIMYMQEQDKMPLQVTLRSIVINNGANTLLGTGTELADRMKLAEQLKYSTIVVSALPLLVVYPFIQKYFAQGVLMGSIKE